MAAGNLEPISLDDTDVEYDEYVGVLEGGIAGRSEQMLDAYAELETRYGERFEAEADEAPDRFLGSAEDAENFRAALAETYDEELYPVLGEAGEADIGGYAEFQDTVRALAELNHVRFLDHLDTARSAVAKVRNHSSNAQSLLNQVGEILTEKGYTHETKEPIKERFSRAKRQLTQAARLRKETSAVVKRCFLYYFTADLVREKYDVERAAFRYVDLDEPADQRLERVREEFVRQERQIRRGRRSLKHKIEYIEKNYDV
ncbi:hypothetical protein [Halorientalis salina]|uniref:hypothetical protein n=1 Tax=Halorientalis salina TaxID=2932266 RepID=UPI0010AB9DBF|nr:hypothetical protein [Halorientalis salina]